MNHHEIETKVLEVDPVAIKSLLEQLGARQLQDVLLTVDWYRDPRRNPDQDEWYLRIRTSSAGQPEVTWKAKADRMSVARKVKEISFHLDHPDELAALFEGIGLECYAHQEKYRTSWEYQDWRFDLDRYPGIPPFLEIEGSSDAHVQEAMTLLGLAGHPTHTDGERTLIQDVYHTNWYAMSFGKN